jgi:hypothetical protein
MAVIIGYAAFIIAVMAEPATQTPAAAKVEMPPPDEPSAPPEAFFEQIGASSRLRSPHVLDLRMKDE